MSVPLGINVEAYDPETDLAKIDLHSLRKRGWPTSVLQCIQALRIPASRNVTVVWAPEATQLSEEK